MNTTRHHLPSKAAAFFSALALLAGLCAAPALHATDYYWQAPTSSTYWNSGISSWKTAPTGGTSDAAFVDGDTFHSNGKAISTEPSSSTFGNGAAVTLVLDGGATDQISVKATGSNTATIGTLISNGGIIVAAQTDGQTHNLRVNDFTAEAAGITYLSSVANGNNRTLYLSIGTLSGAGTFEIKSDSGNNRPVNLGIDDATAFTGVFDFTLGIAHFTADLVSHGSLVLDGTVRLSTSGTIARSLTFSSVTIGGTALDAGTYTFAQLRSDGFSDYINPDAIGSSTITVAPIPEMSASAAIAGAALLAFAAWRRRRA